MGTKFLSTTCGRLAEIDKSFATQICAQELMGYHDWPHMDKVYFFSRSFKNCHSSSCYIFMSICIMMLASCQWHFKKFVLFSISALLLLDKIELHYIKIMRLCPVEDIADT